jgi:hypothetical protein
MNEKKIVFAETERLLQDIEHSKENRFKEAMKYIWDATNTGIYDEQKLAEMKEYLKQGHK